MIVSKAQYLVCSQSYLANAARGTEDNSFDHLDCSLEFVGLEVEVVEYII